MTLCSSEDASSHNEWVLQKQIYFFLRIPDSLQQNSTPLKSVSFHHYIRKRCSKLSLLIWHRFDKHRAKPIFLLFWSHPTRNEVSGGCATHPSNLRSWFLTGSTSLVCRYTLVGSMFSTLTPPVRQLSFNKEIIPRGPLKCLPTAFFIAVLPDMGFYSLEFLPDFTLAGPEQHHCRSDQPPTATCITIGLMLLSL